MYKGGELFHEVKIRGRLAEKDVATLIRQLLSCVSYCHSKGIVHRDLNPQNILLADSGKQKSYENIKIIDFGCSLNCDAKDKFSEMIGTPYYIAPEILRGKGCQKSDIWSVGVIAYICLSGTPPFNGESEREILKKVKNGEISFQSPVWESISTLAK